MQDLPPCYGIIPARYASTRFPGKALADILGKPMFWHVWERARRCPELRSVTLAADDERILKAAAGLGVPALMTSPSHKSGTDRVCEAAALLGLPPDAVVVNVQGDEPALEPRMLTELLRPFADPATRVSTLARQADPGEEASPDKVKVTRALNGAALYFSRSPIPFDREGKAGAFLVHIGLYAFRLEALRLFTSLPPSALEEREKLEQLRFLENGVPIRVEITRGRSLGVDRPEDLAGVVRALRSGASAPKGN